MRGKKVPPLQDGTQRVLLPSSGRGDFIGWGRLIIVFLWLLILMLSGLGTYPTIAILVWLSVLTLLNLGLVTLWIFCWARADKWRKISRGNLLFIWLIWFFFVSPRVGFLELRRLEQVVERGVLTGFGIDLGVAVILVLLRKYFISRWDDERLGYKERVLTKQKTASDSWPDSILLGLAIGIIICFLELGFVFLEARVASALRHMLLPVSRSLAHWASLLWRGAPEATMLSIACFSVGRWSRRSAILRGAFVCVPHVVATFLVPLLVIVGWELPGEAHVCWFPLLLGAFSLAPVLLAFLFLFLGVALHRRKSQESTSDVSSG